MAKRNKSIHASNFFKYLGFILILASLILTLVTIYPVAKLEVSYNITTLSRDEESQEEPLKPPNTDFAIVIPKISATSAIVADVDPYNSVIYQRALTQGVAHAKGSSYPGGGSNTFLFSHSSANFFEASRFNSVFYLINKLETGDAINVFFNDEEFPYSVTTKQIVSSDAVTYLQPTDSETLTLMTCWPPGTTLKRLIVTAHPIQPATMEK